MATAAAGGNDRLGDTLLRDGLLSHEQLKQALVEQKVTKHRLGFVLVKLGLVPELEITKVLARQFRMPAVDLSRFEVDPKILKLVPVRLCAIARSTVALWRWRTWPGSQDSGRLHWPACAIGSKCGDL